MHAHMGRDARKDVVGRNQDAGSRIVRAGHLERMAGADPHRPVAPADAERPTFLDDLEGQRQGIHRAAIGCPLGRDPAQVFRTGPGLPLQADEHGRQHRRVPELAAEVLRNSWLHTGDMAYRDERGFFFIIVDRKKDMVISGGFNVYPKEVEDVLTAHPAVSAAAVIGVPDSRWGEAVKAIVVRRPGMDVSAAELSSYVKAHKGAVAAPKTVDFVEQLPLPVLGKPDKKALRASYWEGQTRAVG
jgi:acyl-CoA synthetase (AMP-forming)/AMP-acid ligase II